MKRLMLFFAAVTFAEIHLVVRDRGPAIPGLQEEMLTTFSGGCNDAPPGGELVGPAPTTVPTCNLQSTNHDKINNVL